MQYFAVPQSCPKFSVVVGNRWVVKECNFVTQRKLPTSLLPYTSSANQRPLQFQRSAGGWQRPQSNHDDMPIQYRQSCRSLQGYPIRTGPSVNLPHYPPVISDTPKQRHHSSSTAPTARHHLASWGKHHYPRPSNKVCIPLVDAVC